ncbi:short chain dehydrogenase [Colletotrichum abscissum]|nr:short chain dehydrogenase [Colletotrichum abscissum]KAK1495057.1 short chain dehydrogenase [Colletotrichum abscissum]
MVDWQPSQPRWQHFLLVTTVMIRGRDVESAAPMPGGRPPNPIVSNTIASESPAGHMGITSHGPPEEFAPKTKARASNFDQAHRETNDASAAMCSVGKLTSSSTRAPKTFEPSRFTDVRRRTSMSGGLSTGVRARHEPPQSTGSKYDAIPGPLGLASASLEGKVALVTGAGRGIGREMALELGRRGAKVIVNYANSAETAEEVVQAIKKSGSDAASIKANVSDVDQIVSMFAEAKKIFGKLHIVCSNSGVVSFGHVKDVTPEEFDRVFSINTRGQFFVAREAYKNLEVGGRVILMGSITGQAKGVPKHAVYSGSKGTIETFVRCMAIDFGDKKITVNAVAPGGIKTDMYRDVCREYIPGGTELDDEGVDEYAAGWSPMHRVGLPIDIARVVCFLASQDGEWINGKVLGIDGAACM